MGTYDDASIVGSGQAGPCLAAPLMQTAFRLRRATFRTRRMNGITSSHIPPSASPKWTMKTGFEQTADGKVCFAHR
jgi:hypothetical protein